MSSNLPAVIGTLMKAVVAGSTSDSADFWKIQGWSVEDLAAGSFE